MADSDRTLSISELATRLAHLSKVESYTHASMIAAEICRRAARVAAYRGTEASYIKNILDTGNPEGHVIAVARVSEESKRALMAPTQE